MNRKKKAYRPENLPTTEQLERELKQEHHRAGYMKNFRSTCFGLIVVAAAAVFIAVRILPILQIYGTSMSPTLSKGNIVISRKDSDFKTGDIIAFYFNNKILVKRVIAQAGDWVDISEDGTVYVNDEEIDEPYLTEKALGECDLELPYQVPESRIFVLGDHRNVSIDSRSSSIGCIAEEQIVGKIFFRVWPMDKLGFVK